MHRGGKGEKEKKNKKRWKKSINETNVNYFFHLIYFNVLIILSWIFEDLKLALKICIFISLKAILNYYT